MNISSIVRDLKGKYFLIDTCKLTSLVGNMIDKMGMGNNDALGHPFETMVFASDKRGKVTDWDDLDKKNYDSWSEAKEGHEKMVKKWGNVIKSC